MSTIPVKYQKPPDVIKNRDWELPLIYRVKSTQARIDITNYTFECEFRYDLDDSVAAATATVTKTDESNGEFNIHVSDTLTDALDFTTYKAINFALKVTEPSAYVYDYIYGTCTMKLSATT